jgi:hypothetical protein
VPISSLCFSHSSLSLSVLLPILADLQLEISPTAFKLSNNFPSTFRQLFYFCPNQLMAARIAWLRKSLGHMTPSSPPDEPCSSKRRDWPRNGKDVPLSVKGASAIAAIAQPKLMIEAPKSTWIYVCPTRTEIRVALPPRRALVAARRAQKLWISKLSDNFRTTFGQLSDNFRAFSTGRLNSRWRSARIGNITSLDDIHNCPLYKG